MTNQIPILLVGYNRPELMRRVLNCIEKWPYLKLYISIDGPKTVIDNDSVKLVHILVSEHLSTKKQAIRFMPHNLGSKKHMLDSLKWFFANESSGIILEDDCLPDETFYLFCKNLLSIYKDDKNVLMISGTHFNTIEHNPNIHTFSTFPHVWGWASWKDRVDNYLNIVNDPKTTNPLDAMKNVRGFGFINSVYWALIALNVKFSKIDAWDYQLALFAFKNNYLTAIPPINIVENIGFDVKPTNFFFKVNNFISQDKFSLINNDFYHTPPNKNSEYDLKFVTNVIESNRVITILKPLITLIFPKILILKIKRIIRPN